MRTRWLCKRVAVLLSAYVATAFAFTAGGQALPAAGRIAGVLSDPSGAVVPGGRVTVRNLESNLTRMALSDRQGGYVLDGLPAGRYRMTAAAAGLRSARARPLSR
jgi:hypothetical protein